MMYFEECHYHDRIGIEVLKTLTSFGLKYSLKKPILKTVLMEDKHKEVHIFGQPLHALKQEEVLLPQAKEYVSVPEFLVRTCSCIEENITVEGLFRKAGSSVRQKEIKVILDRGGYFDSTSLHVIDLANILKTFLRELPEPLIPYKYHDTFLRCILLKEKRDEAVILTCLLLPQDHLNTLAFLMMFLNGVAAHADYNKMTIENLAIIIAPNILPIATPKMTPQSNQILNYHVEICQILIQNAHLIGVVPDHMLSGDLSFSNSSLQNSYTQDKSNKKKNKRRSSSLSRVFTGLKKMVSGRATPDFDSSVTSDKETHTPCIMSAGKKRKAAETASAPLSSKKKKELMQGLPQGSVLSDTPYKSRQDKKTEKLTPRILVAAQKPTKSKTPPQKVKRRFFSKSNADGLVQKPVKTLAGSGLKMSRISLLGRSTRKKKDKDESRISNDSTSMVATMDSMEETQSLSSFSDLRPASEEYVRVPKSEYEAIKERVSKIESRLSHEFENIVGVSMSDDEVSPHKSPSIKSVSSAIQVENAYKKTLRESDWLNFSSTEELANRLSQELHIRRNSETKVFRSPSARKIRSIRRRSQDNSVPLNSESCVVDPCATSCPLLFNPGRSLRRGKPNTVCTGLPHPNFKAGVLNLSSQSFAHKPSNGDERLGILTRSQARRASSFHGVSNQRQTKCSNLQMENDGVSDWKCGATYFEHKPVNNEVENETENRRESIAKLRQNAGMVLAKAKLFDNMVGSDVLPKEQKITRLNSKTFRHNSAKCRSSVRRKHYDRRPQGGSMKLLNNVDLNNSPARGLKSKQESHKANSDALYQNINNFINDQTALHKQNITYGKENIYSKDKPTQTEYNYKNTAVSPLKDVNRTPNIKQSLIGNLTSQFKRTPRDIKVTVRSTPVKPFSHAVTTRRSPRLLLKSKNV